MKIAHRLYLTVVPAIIGVFTVVGLAYWGRYAHTIPHVMLGIAAVAALGSMILSWQNARYVAHRVERLAGSPSGDHPSASLKGVASALMPGRGERPPDELDAIEGVVDHLTKSVVVAESERATHEQAAEQRLRSYAKMIAQVAKAAAAQMEQVRVPLHILLENHFGDLNENQEEMLGAARSGAETVDADLIALGQIAELDLGTRVLRRDRLLPGDLLRALVPTLQAAAEHSGSTMHVDIEPLVPAIHADQPQLHDALTTLFGGAIRSSASGASLELTLLREDGEVRFALAGGGSPDPSVRGALAERIVIACGGRITRAEGGLFVAFRN